MFPRSETFRLLAGRVATSWPVARWADVTVVVAVSGGADSVALLRSLDLLRRATPGRGQLIAGHVNHQLRGSDSEEDERWTAHLAGQLGIPYQSRRAPRPPASLKGQSLEGFLRAERYKLLGQMAEDAGARYLATGHQANDQAETVLFRIARGTGVDGLAGIPRTRALGGGITVVRPMLGIPREEIVAALAGSGQTWRTDSTNDNPQFTRNRIRQALARFRDRTGIDPVPVLASLAEKAALVRAGMDRSAGEVIRSRFRFAGTEGDNGFVILPDAIPSGGDSAGRGPLEPEILLHAVRIAWSRQKWPLAEMSRKKWESVAAILKQAEIGQDHPAVVLPGVIAVRSGGGRVFFCRSSRHASPSGQGRC